jgi:Carboxypeptidase regulatory-like domain/Putative binding domain, N-terminal
MIRCVTAGVVAALLACLPLATACTKSSPSQPTPTAKPNIGVASISVAAEALRPSGYTYRVTVKLRESGGVSATIAAIDLAFMRESTTLASLRADRPLPDASSVVPANATVDSRELTATDSDPSHPVSTSVVAKVTFGDSAAATSSTSGTADIPAPAPLTFTLLGTISDENSARMVAGGTVQILDGPNAGKTSLTDAGGAYSLSGLISGSFMLRATASGYDPREQGVTIARDMALDLKLRPISGPTPPPAPPPLPAPSPPDPCAYTATPNQTGAVVIDYNGGNLSATITRTAGTCSWQAISDVSWLTFPSGASGNGSATLTYSVASNPSLNPRIGNVTVSWTGGSAQIRVGQGNHPDWECFVGLIKGSQDFDNVPSAGGQLTASVSVFATPQPWSPQCSATTSSNVSWISGGGSVTGGGPNNGNATFTFTVAPNPSPGTPRTGSIVATTSGKTATLTVSQR